MNVTISVDDRAPLRSTTALSIILSFPLGALGKRAMRLETEFRLCLQRYSLEWTFQQLSNDAAPITPSDNAGAIAPSVWVKLLHLPSDYSADEALLLCQCSAQQWLAWIPDYGEIMLERRQFEPLSE